MSGEWWRPTHQLVPNEIWTEVLQDRDRLRGLLREAVSHVNTHAFSSADRLAERIDAALSAADNSPPLQVTCARCGLAGTSDTFYIEEGDEWECPACWERCEAAERAAAEELLMNGGKKK